MSKQELLKYVEDTVKVQEHPNFKAGDTITVQYEIREGDKTRLQNFQGVVLQRKGSGVTETFTIRKISNNIGVEKILPIVSPAIKNIIAAGSK